MTLITPSAIQNAVTGKKVLVDTNVIIYLTDSIPYYVDLSRRLFEIIEHGDASAVFSTISIAEVIQGPIRKGDIRCAMDVKNYLMNFPNSLCQEITASVVEYIWSDFQITWSNLRAMDSLIIASGLVNEVDLFISNDDHFKKAIPQANLLSFDI